MKLKYVHKYLADLYGSQCVVDKMFDANGNLIGEMELHETRNWIGRLGFCEDQEVLYATDISHAYVLLPHKLNNQVIMRIQKT